MIQFLIDSKLLLTLLLIIIAFVNRKTIYPEPKELTTRWKIVTIIIVLIALPALLYSVFTITFAYFINPSDYWYQKAAKQASFHLYKINPISGMVANNYQNGGKIGTDINNAVKVFLGYPIQEQLKGKYGSILVNQVGVDSAYNLDDLIKKIKPSPNIQIDKISLVPSTIAYLEKINLKQATAYLLFFKTPDNVLVSVSTVDQPLESVYQVANSFFPSISLTPTLIIPAPTLIPVSTIKPTPESHQIKAKITPIPTKPLENKFVSSGVKEIETGISAQILSASTQNSTISINIKFTNTGNSVQNAAVIRVSMYDQTSGTPSKEGILNLPLSPGESRNLVLTYDQLQKPPFTWKYATLGGSLVTLGIYNH